MDMHPHAIEEAEFEQFYSEYPNAAAIAFEANKRDPQGRAAQDDARRAEIERYRKGGQFVVVSLFPVHCPSTDAILRTGVRLIAHYSNEVDAMAHLHEIMAAGAEYDDFRCYAPRAK